jgi:hypothetical protein
MFLACISNRKVRVGSEWVKFSQVNWETYDHTEATNDFKRSTSLFFNLDDLKKFCNAAPKMHNLSPTQMELLKDLHFYEKMRAKHEVASEAWWLWSDHIAKVKYMIKHDKRVCSTCLGQSDRSSPCGSCGTGFLGF